MSDDDIYCIGDDDIRERLVISIFTLCSPHIPVAPLLICTMAGFIRWATTLTELIGGGQFPVWDCYYDPTSHCGFFSYPIHNGNCDVKCVSGPFVWLLASRCEHAPLSPSPSPFGTPVDSPTETPPTASTVLSSSAPPAEPTGDTPVSKAPSPTPAPVPPATPPPVPPTPPPSSCHPTSGSNYVYRNVQST